MPPPTLFDPWLANRRFGLVIDAGSSGSRIQLYSWRDARVVQTELSAKALASLPIVDKGTKDADDSVLKIEPGLSTFGPDPEGIFKYLEPLIKHAKSEIPPHLHAETPLFLLATAGMRLLPEGQQNSILRKVCQYFRDYTDFKIDKSGPLGPCGASVRIISGEEEGVFGWIAINYLMESFPSISSRDEKKAENTYGFLDMGGASTQIAFEPSSDAQDVHPVQLRLLNGKDVTHNVFVATWLGYGTNQARQRYVGKLVDDYEEKKGHHENMIPDPCLPMDLKRFESSPRAQGSTEHSHKQHTLIGSGNFTKCLDQTAPLLNKDSPCVDIPCLFGGKRVPTIDFSVSRFIGVSEYWYSSEDIFGLGGAYDFVQYERAATDFCMQEWGKIRAHHDKLKETTTKGGAGGHVGGDGELERDGKIVALGNWNPRVELSRLELQCFKAAWIVNVLHEGLGMPRIVDPGGNVTNTKAVHQVNESAKGKGLGKPTFQSADTIDDTAITWTLGKMVLEASKEIQSSSGHSLPIPDPLLPSAEPDTIAIGDSGFFDYLGHRASHHLPPALKGDILGFPIIMIMFYAMLCSIIAFAYMRMKKRIRITVRRLLRQTGLRQDREDAMEMNGG
ncbi:Golgi apyrase, partial [Serendipita sp. 397]